MLVESANSESQRVTHANILVHDRVARHYENAELNQVCTAESFQAARLELERLSASSGTGRLLDIGCGSGFILHAADSLFSEVYGVDASMNMLLLARRYRAQLVRASAYTLPFTDNAFHCVTCHATLHHLHDLEALFREIHRVLLPGGILYIDHDPNQGFKRWFGWQIGLRRILLKRHRQRAFDYGDEDLMRLAEYHHYHSGGISGPEVRQRLACAGFSEVEIRYSFPDRPDRFARILMSLDRLFPWQAFHYFVSFVARKAANS